MIRRRSADAGKTVMPSTHFPNISLFEEATRRLTAEGFERTGNQCRAKFKRLKGAFFEVLECFQGISPHWERPLHFSTLRRLWDRAERPCQRDRRHASKFLWKLILMFSILEKWKLHIDWPPYLGFMLIKKQNPSNKDDIHFWRTILLFQYTPVGFTSTN